MGTVARRIGSSALAVAGALALGEVGLRLVPLPHERPQPSIEVRTPDGGWLSEKDGGDPYVRFDIADDSGGIAYTFKPSLELRYVYPRQEWPDRAPGHSAVATTNASGRRGTDLSKERTDGVARAVVLGDSITFGHGVADGTTYPELLERRLSALGSAEVLNGGISGYNTRDCAAYLRNELLDYQPDLVVYGLYLNDALIGAPSLEDRGFREEVRGFLAEFPTEVDVRPPRSRLWGLIQRERRRRAYLALVRSFYAMTYRADGEGWELVSREIEAMRRDADGAGARFLLVTLPMLFDLDGGYLFAGAHDTIRTWCEENGIEHLDVLDELESAPIRSFRVHPLDMHYNSELLQRVADRIAERIEARALLWHNEPPKADTGR